MKLSAIDAKMVYTFLEFNTFFSYTFRKYWYFSLKMFVKSRDNYLSVKGNRNLGRP